MYTTRQGRKFAHNHTENGGRWLLFAKSFGEMCGKCRSMSIAVPCAILYTRAQYATLAENLDNSLNPRLAREREVKIFPESELYKELTLWLQIHTELINGSVWILPTRIHLRLLAYTDASSRRWGGVFKRPDQGVIHMGEISQRKKCYCI